MNIDTIIGALESHPQIQMLLLTIKPFLPVIIREGKTAYEDFLSYSVEGKWVELDQKMWSKMTEDERDVLSSQVLEEARQSVDNQYQRDKTARETAIKIASALLLAIL